jgi:hypothetical protein
MTVDLLLVGEQGDALLDAIEDVADIRGLRWRRVTPAELASMAILKLERGRLTCAPAVPMLVRTVQEYPASTDLDEMYLRAERLATVWTLAAASAAPVVNRPTADGLQGRAVPNAVISGLRADPAAVTVGQARQEIFGSDPVPVGTEVQDFGSGLVHWSVLGRSRSEDVGPYRSRRGEPDDTTVTVVVVRDRWWTRRPAACARHQAGPRSVELVRRLGLTFAAVVWTERAGLDQRATLARIELVPSVATLEPFTIEVADELVEVVLSTS